MGFHRKFGPGANPNSRWFSLLAKAASLTCFEDWHDLATQDGTFGDSQRHDPIPGNEPIQRIIHRWGIVGNSRHGIASDAVTTDEFEVWFDKGVTDGLPVVPPTRERVERMRSGTRRSPDELLGEMPPNYGRLTVEKAAINAVLAGCRPEYLPVVIAAAECACDPAFNLHGVSTSTHFSAPLIVVNGPIRTLIGLNSAFGVFGPGYRANATIGRALRLMIINIGGARPGEMSMSTFGHPGRYTYCIAEHEEASPWPPYHVSRGVAPEVSTVTLFGGEAPHGISDHASRTAKALAGSLGWSMVGIWNSKHFPLYSHTMLVVGPEHARTFAGDGWTRERLARHLYETVRVPYRALVPNDDHGEGTNLRYGKTPPAPDTLIPKFPSPEEIHIVVAGGTAGRFSVAIPGWLGTKNGSTPVTRPVEFD